MSGQALLSDLRHATRSLRRTPGFTLIAVLTLGLGIGANTSMFSVLDGYMLRKVPYPDAASLERLYRSTPREARGGVSPAEYLALRSKSDGYGEIAAYASADMRLSEPGRPAEMAYGLRVSANLFSTLGTTPRLGRGFRPDEEILGNHRVLVISHRYWQSRFGGDAGVVGRTVRVDGEPHQIVGVLPPGFSDWRHLEWVNLYRPLGLEEKEIRDRSATWLRLLGRRSATVTRAQSSAFVAAFGRRLAADFPAVDADATWLSVPIDETFLPRNGQVMVAMLIGLSGFVLLIACSNLANLLLARTMARTRELAVRSALGASRSRVLRPLIVESLLLALGGGTCAILVALWAFDWMAAASIADNGSGMFLTLDWHVLAWAFGACLFTAVAFGVAPALFARRLDLNSALRSGSRAGGTDRGHRRFRDALIVGQFALAMVLLAGAAHFVGGLRELNNRRCGWDSDHLVTGTISLPGATYGSDAEVLDFQRLSVERLEALPGVASASVSYSMPFFGLAEPRKYLVAGSEIPPAGHEPVAVINGVSPRYFETVGTRLLRGRVFSGADTLDSPRVFIVNQAMARGLFGAGSPLGKRIAPAGGTSLQWGEIVGVVDDVQSVYPDGTTVPYQLYLPLAQEPRPQYEVAVRTAGIPPASLVDGIRTTLAALDADLPVRKLQPASATIARANYAIGVIGSILSSLAALGLGLASLGVYGVVARTVAHRTGEFGIRIAMGARGRDITRLVLTSGAKLALAGAALGLLGALGTSLGFAAAFPGIRGSSPGTLLGFALLLVAIAQFACYVPARSAARMSPTEALRAD